MSINLEESFGCVRFIEGFRFLGYVGYFGYAEFVKKIDILATEIIVIECTFKPEQILACDKKIRKVRYLIPESSDSEGKFRDLQRSSEMRKYICMSVFSAKESVISHYEIQPL